MRDAGGDHLDLTFDWNDRFEVQIKGFRDKVASHTSPGKNALTELKHVEEYVPEANDERMMACCDDQKLPST